MSRTKETAPVLPFAPFDEEVAAFTEDVYDRIFALQNMNSEQAEPVVYQGQSHTMWKTTVDGQDIRIMGTNQSAQFIPHLSAAEGLSVFVRTDPESTHESHYGMVRDNDKGFPAHAQRSIAKAFGMPEKALNIRSGNDFYHFLAEAVYDVPINERHVLIGLRDKQYRHRLVGIYEDFADGQPVHIRRIQVMPFAQDTRLQQTFDSSVYEVNKMEDAVSYSLTKGDYKNTRPLTVTAANFDRIQRVARCTLLSCHIDRLGMPRH
jgi:hypothetical protein